MLRSILLNPIFNVLLLIYAVLPGNDFGVAVIILTIIIRILLWPLVKKQLHHQKAMKDLQPEIAKIKAKAKGNRTQESQMMVELFKEKEVNPFGSIGLALLQFPILIALFFVLRDVIEPAKIADAIYPFVANLGPVKEIFAHTDQFHPSLLGIVDMAKPNVVLAALAGIVQYVQAKQLTPQDTTKSSPGSNLGFNIALIFPILTVVIAMQLPSALALYWIVSGLIAIYQQHRILSADVSFMQSILPKRKNVRAN
jgi:YidC/Oxa1 family membrane protein insertase